MRDTVQIGEVADRIGLSLRTIRYYEEVGLAVPSARSDGGFRLYVEADVERLRVIMQMKPLGFSLEEMRELLEVLDAGGPPERLAHFRAAAADRVAGLRDQLATAEAFAGRLGTAPQ